MAAAVGLSQVRVNAIAMKHGFGAVVGNQPVFTHADVKVIRARRSWWGKRPERRPVPTLYSAAEVAARLGLSTGTIDAFGKSGMGQKVGRGHVFTPEEVVLLEARRESQRPSTNEREQTFYSVSAAAVRLGANREVVQEMAERLDLGRRKGQVNGRLLAEGEVERVRRELREGTPDAQAG